MLAPGCSRNPGHPDPLHRRTLKACEEIPVGDCRRIQSGSAKANIVLPAAIATYCLPETR